MRHKNRFAHGNGIVGVDSDDGRAEEMACAAPDQALMFVGEHHCGNVVAASHRPALDVVGAVGRPQSRRGIGFAGIDKRAVGGDQPLDRAFILDESEPSLKLCQSLVCHVRSDSAFRALEVLASR
jgi:hypothetical protein